MGERGREGERVGERGVIREDDINWDIREVVCKDFCKGVCKEVCEGVHGTCSERP